MAPPHKVRNLHCRASFVEGARSVLGVRLAEVEARRTDISGPEDSRALHDLRIAAKRLRYSLETFAVAFSPGVADAHADRVRELQDVLGRIHDLDVLERLLAGRIASMDMEARLRGLDIARGTADESTRLHELQRLVWGDGRHARLGLYSLIGSKADERREQYRRFLALWSEWEESDMFQSIHAMIAEPPGPEGEEESVSAEGSDGQS